MRNLTVIVLGAIACIALSDLARAKAEFAFSGTGQDRPLISEDRVRSADARDYRHCHTIGTRTYCHRRDQLPVNWPPLSNTPAPA